MRASPCPRGASQIGVAVAWVPVCVSRRPACARIAGRIRSPAFVGCACSGTTTKGGSGHGDRELGGDSWGPMLLLVVVWVYFMRRYDPSRMWQEHITRYKEHMGPG